MPDARLNTYTPQCPEHSPTLSTLLTQRNATHSRIQDQGSNTRVPDAAGAVDNRFEGLDPKVWWPLATEAEARGITVRALLDEKNARPEPLQPSALQVLASEIRSARADGFRVPRRENPQGAEDRAWRADQKRRQYLESFRNMTEEWSA